MTNEEFESMVRETIKTLPALLRKKLQNIDVVIEDAPIDQKNLLGLYHGVPLRKRGIWYGNVLPDRIILFKDNIERISYDDNDLRARIRSVVMHEIGHYFGFDDRELYELDR